HRERGRARGARARARQRARAAGARRVPGAGGSLRRSGRHLQRLRGPAPERPRRGCPARQSAARAPRRGGASGATALAREAELALAPPEPATVAVLPLVIAGDSGVQPLSRGLAELIATDLAYIRTLRL